MDKEKTKADLIIKNAAQLITCEGTSGDVLGIIENGCLAVVGERIAAVGTEAEVLNLVDCTGADEIDAKGKVVVPGFVDCHTHLVFGGSRLEEYVAKLTIDNPETIKRMGIKTGLAASMEMTEDILEDDLFETSAAKIRRMMCCGTTTVESKSGYGLNLTVELKQLRVNKRLHDELPIDLKSTFLGAHGWPADMSKQRYLDLLINCMIPAVGGNMLAEFCDVWCDDGYYTAGESELILQAGRDAGLEPRIHTDAYSYIGGSDIAAEMKMMSADHLNYTPLRAIKKLAAAKVPGVLLPGTDFAVNHPKPFNPRPMIEEGMVIALATNCNPGNWTESMQFVMMLACKRHRMTPAEALKAATKGGAAALGLSDEVGSFKEGKLADIQIWDTPVYENVIYRLGGNLVDKVIKRGKIVVENGKFKEGKTDVVC
ncbi:MAG: imidazolonepropionase [Clostridiaceae bacterium]